MPAILSTGVIVVAFENNQNEAIWLDPDGQPAADEFDDQYLVVRSTNGGATWSAPIAAASLVDGASDYPINQSGRQTLTGYQLRVNSAGNVAAFGGGKLAIVFADNRVGTASATDTNVYAVFSSNGGVTWGQPVGIDTSAGDQWFPWGAFDPEGKLGVVYNSRNAGDAELYNAVLAEESGGGGYVKTTLSTSPSNPVDSLFFQAADTPGCETCSLFDGDYIGLEYDASGVAHAVWTDMSLRITDHPVFGSGYAQLIGYAAKK